MVGAGTVAVSVQWLVPPAQPGGPLHVGGPLTAHEVFVLSLATASTVTGSRKLHPVMVMVTGFCVSPVPGVTLSMVGGGRLVTRKAAGRSPPPPSGLMITRSYGPPT